MRTKTLRLLSCPLSLLLLAGCAHTAKPAVVPVPPAVPAPVAAAPSMPAPVVMTIPLPPPPPKPDARQQARLDAIHARRVVMAERDADARRAELQGEIAACDVQIDSLTAEYNGTRPAEFGNDADTSAWIDRENELRNRIAFAKHQRQGYVEDLSFVPRPHDY